MEEYTVVLTGCLESKIICNELHGTIKNVPERHYMVNIPCNHYNMNEGQHIFTNLQRGMSIVIPVKYVILVIPYSDEKL